MSSPRPNRRSFLKATAVAASAATPPLARSAHAAGSDVIRIGMIGCGGRCTGAAANAMQADPGVKLVAMTDLFLDRVKSRHATLLAQKPKQVEVDAAHMFSGVQGYKQVIDCVDVVLIACAAKFHPYYLHEALKAGKHVFVEKPHAIDPAGCQEVLRAGETARKKKLCVMSGLQSRYHPGYQETMKRIHDGAIGDIISIEENFLRAPYGVYKRTPGYNEVQYQCSNQYHFTWLSGDDVPQSLVHNLDRATWLLHEAAPLKCHGLGGRSSMTHEDYGNVFDHHSVIYEYANGVRLYAFCRTELNCYNENSSIYLGSKGKANLVAMRIEGANKWRYEGPAVNPYDEEHNQLFKAIRAGQTINNTDYMAKSTLAGVMGQISCYTGKEVTWEQAVRSEFFFAPKWDEVTFEMKPPVEPVNGSYPVPIPGFTEYLKTAAKKA